MALSTYIPCSRKVTVVNFDSNYLLIQLSHSHTPSLLYVVEFPGLYPRLGSLAPAVATQGVMGQQVGANGTLQTGASGNQEADAGTN